MININTPNTLKALIQHWGKLEPILKKRIKGLAITMDECKSIITGKPDELLTIEKDLVGREIITSRVEMKKDKRVLVTRIGNKTVSSIFNYTEFSKKTNEGRGVYGAYQLARNLDIRVCPYCNRMYTVTVVSVTKEGEEKFIIRPEFDHYFSQSAHPLLALSFYNLIPSCSVCNSTVKGTKELKLGSHVHPYMDNEINDFDFNYVFDKIKINVTKGTRISDTLDFFKIEEIYNEHKDIAEDLVQLSDVFSKDYLHALAGTYKDLDISKEQLYRLVFATYLDEENFHKRPFSKFKKDIVKKLDLYQPWD